VGPDACTILGAQFKKNNTKLVTKIRLNIHIRREKYNHTQKTDLNK
jgi:hypothetical protein